MRNAAFLALLLAAQEVAAAPVTVYETTTAVATANSVPSATIATQATAPATIPSSSAGSSGSSSGFMDFIESLYSAVTSGSSSGSTSTGSSGSGSTGSSWKSMLSSFLSKLEGSSSSSTPAATTAALTGTATTTSASNALFSAASPLFGTGTTSPSLATGTTTSTTSTSKQTPSGSTSTPTSASSGGIYDAIYNSSEDIDTSFAVAILDAHNTYRAEHGVGDLSWAEGPYQYAKNNADNYDCSGVLTHTHGQYGENLAAGFATGPAAVTAWYVEGETFSYSSYNEYNHFTQLIWKGSTQVGCAYKDCSAEGWQKYVVCEYSPVGNVIGQEQANVLPPVS